MTPHSRFGCVGLLVFLLFCCSYLSLCHSLFLLCSLTLFFSRFCFFLFPMSHNFGLALQCLFKCRTLHLPFDDATLNDGSTWTRLLSLSIFTALYLPFYLPPTFINSRVLIQIEKFQWVDYGWTEKLHRVATWTLKQSSKAFFLSKEKLIQRVCRFFFSSCEALLCFCLFSSLSSSE